MQARWLDIGWVLVVGIASSVWCLTAATRLGATFDEPLYVKAGLVNWRTGSNKLLMRAGTMPLPVDVQTLPVYLWERFRGQEFDPVVELHTLLPVCRAANLVFWWLLLVYTFRLGRTFGGTWGGRIAVTLVASEPNLLAHAALATTDIALVACLMVLIDHFYRCYHPSADWKRRVLLPGLLYGVALSAKASALAFGPQAMLVLGLWNLAQAGVLTPAAGSSYCQKIRHFWHATYLFRKDIIAIGLIGLVVLFAYCGCDWSTEPTFIRWADQLPEGPLKRVMQPVSQQLRIFTNAGEALVHQIKHNIRGHGTYLLGQWYPRATPWYFPLALSMKVPLPVVALLVMALVVHPRRLWMPTAAVALLLLAFTPHCRVQIGIRFMFPLMVLVYITIAAAIARGWQGQQETGCRRVVPRWFVALMLAILASTSVAIWPHGLNYFNQAWGGREAGVKLLHGSNTDWGQGIPELREWNRTFNANQPLAVWYYGTDPDVFQPPLVFLNLSWIPIQAPDDVKILSNTQYLAVSVAILYNNPAPTPPHATRLAWIRTQTPVAHTTHFAIYQLRP